MNVCNKLSRWQNSTYSCNSSSLLDWEPWVQSVGDNAVGPPFVQSASHYPGCFPWKGKYKLIQSVGDNAVGPSFVQSASHYPGCLPWKGKYKLIKWYKSARYLFASLNLPILPEDQRAPRVMCTHPLFHQCSLSSPSPSWCITLGLNQYSWIRVKTECPLASTLHPISMPSLLVLHIPKSSL